MATLHTTDEYYESILQITSPKLQIRLEKLIRLIAEVPTVGSSLCRDWVREKYGKDCLTVELSPFMLVYDYDSETDEAVVYGIIHQRQVL